MGIRDGVASGGEAGGVAVEAENQGEAGDERIGREGQAEKAEGLGKGGGGDDVIERLFIDEPGGAGRGQGGDGGFEADVETTGEIAGETAVAGGVEKAFIGGKGVA